MNIPKPNNNNSTGNSLVPSRPVSNMIAPPRVDFIRERYDELIAQKGVDCYVEKALQCPCKTSKINALSTCRNCGGTGWVFVNRRPSRIVLQGMNFKNTEDVWSKLVHGIVKVTYAPEEEFAYMDRIVRLNANSVFSEVVEFEEYQDKIYGFTTYEPKEIEYMGLYVSDEEKFLQITPDQFEITNNRIDLKEGIDLPTFDFDAPLTATVRYIHAPTFNMVEIDREAVDNFRWDGKGEVLQYLPALGLARRTHNIDDLTRLRQGKLNDNSYDEHDCCTAPKRYVPNICPK